MTKTHRDAVLKLRDFGIFLRIGHADTTAIVAAIEASTALRRRPKEGMWEFMDRYVNPPAPHMPRWVAPFRPLMVHPHPRQAEIDVLPHQVSMHGVGNARR